MRAGTSGFTRRAKVTAQRASNNRSFQNIHGCTFRMDEIAFDVKRGAVEIWRINYPAERVSREIGL